MQVRDLIEQLQKLDGDIEINVQGGGTGFCEDCEEQVGGNISGEISNVEMSPVRYRAVIICE